MTRWQRIKCKLGFHDWFHTSAKDLTLRDRTCRTCLRCDRVEMFAHLTEKWFKL
jgi:hypothetical protein